MRQIKSYSTLLEDELKEIENIFTFVDKNNNEFELIGDSLFLILGNNKPSRQIGKIKSKKGKLAFVKREKESDKFRKTNAWSIPLSVLKKVSYVAIQTEKFLYEIDKKTALEKGNTFHFKNSTEIKLYVPVKYFNTKTILWK